MVCHNTKTAVRILRLWRRADPERDRVTLKTVLASSLSAPRPKSSPIFDVLRGRPGGPRFRLGLTGLLATSNRSRRAADPARRPDVWSAGIAQRFLITQDLDFRMSAVSPGTTPVSFLCA